MAQYYEGIGRRKESTARVRLTTGSGKMVVNEKEGAVYFPRLGDLDDILRPFSAVGQEAAKYDVSVIVSGGGTTGQTGCGGKAGAGPGQARTEACCCGPSWTEAGSIDSR